MIIKKPCIIDVSHWEVPVWESLDARVVGTLMKASQGRYYVDPTFADSWARAGAKGIPRGAYHFFDFDAPNQVENFLTACEDAGAIVAGKWVGEIEPVLDAEVQPPKADPNLVRNSDFWGRNKHLQKNLNDLADAKEHLKINMRVGKDADAKVVTAFSASELARQYKAWLDGVESELKVRPIIYTSKWMWMNAGSPVWGSNYKLWVAQYPWQPDGQNAPAYLPIGWTEWFLWQYSDEGKLEGIDESVDVNVFNGTLEKWTELYGGGGTPPPPQESKMYEVTPTAGKTYINVRADHSASAQDIGDLLAGQIAKGDELWLSGTTEKWLKVHTVNGVALDGWIAVISNGKVFTDLTETRDVEIAIKDGTMEGSATVTLRGPA